MALFILGPIIIIPMWLNKYCIKKLCNKYEKFCACTCCNCNNKNESGITINRTHKKSFLNKFKIIICWIIVMCQILPFFFDTTRYYHDKSDDTSYIEIVVPLIFSCILILFASGWNAYNLTMIYPAKYPLLHLNMSLQSNDTVAPIGMLIQG